jgi:hypothetical protein
MFSCRLNGLRKFSFLIIRVRITEIESLLSGADENDLFPTTMAFEITSFLASGI